ncbi:hypothetical protein FA95DRAFT_1491867 [Auriscalpium vulgare]|uniref:Uncharacterized protein n=1 Tax=Auriscalpium vulgare TaxID=40419 RepID=A0ACB8RV13_9AGAM|nr:hypothetical protein FA95DRAFT_1491867 [Auriscalpium vulgare]
MASLNGDILHLVALEIYGGSWGSDRIPTLANFAAVSRDVRTAVLPLLFRKVSWPHRRKVDDLQGLHFFPEALWPHFSMTSALTPLPCSRHFVFDWPHEWLDRFPPKYGDYGSDPYSRNYYAPRHLEPLLNALPTLQLTHVTLRCPFVPPIALVSALLKCPTLHTLSCEDTPLDCPLPTQAFPALTTLALVAVGEGLRIGDGKVDPRIADRFLWVRAWKNRYRARRELRLPMEAWTAMLLLARHASRLRTMQLSGDLCDPGRLAACHWPELHTFILTGHVPGPPYDSAPLSVALARMPRVRDVRLLLAKSPDKRLLNVLPPESSADMLPSTLTHFAVSTACALDRGLLARGPGLSSVAIVSIMDFPRLPIALSLAEAANLITDLSSGASPRQLRIMIEDKLAPDFCAYLSTRLPLLEELEIEVCGYHDGKPAYEWHEFAQALAPLTHLRSLRICIQFPEFDDVGVGAPWWDVRAACAAVLVEQLPTLHRVGLEYRERTGTHKYQDSWLEFDVVRKASAPAAGAVLVDGSKEVVDKVVLEPQPTRCYEFPEVWETCTGAYE